MRHTKLRSILEGLDDSLSILRDEEEEEVEETEEDVAEEEEEAEEIEDAQSEGDLSSAAAVEAVLNVMGREAALYIFGKQVDELPRLQSQPFESQQVTEELAPFMEDFGRLTRVLYESKTQETCLEHYERAAALYLLSEGTGVAFDVLLTSEFGDLIPIVEAYLDGPDIVDEDGRLNESVFLAPLAADPRRSGTVARGLITSAAKELAQLAGVVKSAAKDPRVRQIAGVAARSGVEKVQAKLQRRREAQNASADLSSNLMESDALNNIASVLAEKKKVRNGGG